ncbi:MAG: Gfo/Idh/MocA family oxidoreductase [Lentisphaerae bacterium]|nr:Gfo/Idh/MocA family oxidoreductase [Lentisphaerota bacterium]
MKRKLRMGMVGGGPGAFIGDVHRRAARLNGDIELVAGVFGTNVEKSRQCGAELFVDPARVYPNYEAMIAGELALPADKRIDFVSVVTPNLMHYPISNAFLKAGFHVLCEKPIAMSAADAEALGKTQQASGKFFALMHNYTGYPMIKQAKKLIADGVLGELRKINVEYSLGWLAAPNAGKQAVWRVDPKQAGISGCMADIGTHAEQLIHYLSGLRITAVSADLASFIPGRELDDDGSVLLRFNSGARGVIFASEVSTGEENNFIIKIYGSKAALEWHQQSPEDLIIRSNDAPMLVYRRGWPGTGEEAQKVSHLPAGHPEGFLEAFAAIYRAFADAIHADLNGDQPVLDFPGIQDGIDEMRFLEAIVANSSGDAKWTAL